MMVLDPFCRPDLDLWTGLQASNVVVRLIYLLCLQQHTSIFLLLYLLLKLMLQGCAALRHL